MEVSYEYMVDKIQEISLSHKQVNDFGYGDPWEVNKKQYDYPLVFLTDGVSKFFEGTFYMNFKLMVFDKTVHSEINEKKVLSNCQLIGVDIISKLYDDSLDEDKYIVSLDDIEFRPFTNSFADDDAGWVIDLTIEIGNAINSCDKPFV